MEYSKLFYILKVISRLLFFTRYCITSIPDSEETFRTFRTAKNYLSLSPILKDHAVHINFEYNNDIKLKGELGVGLPTSLGHAAECESKNAGVHQCFQWGDQARLEYTHNDESPENKCQRIEWSTNSSFIRRLVDCFKMEKGVYWYGGGDGQKQSWPINKQKNRKETATTSRNPSINSETDFGGITENYWINSKGTVIQFDEQIPLFFSMNTTKAESICFASQDTFPYKTRNFLTLKYTICMGDNVRRAHRKWIRTFYDPPADIPNLNRLIRPSWSTWMTFGDQIHQKAIVSFAQNIHKHGFVKNSHIQLDGRWETCYGDMVFDKLKFPNPKAMVKSIKKIGFKITLWVHPFINNDCKGFKEGLDNNYFVRDERSTDLTKWWKGENTGIIDFTNAKAVQWWKNRIDILKDMYQIDSFKFVAGQTYWLPFTYNFGESVEFQPNIHTIKYAEIASTYGNLSEIGSVRGSQNLQVSVRIMDKETTWDSDNGLQTVIPSVLHAQMLGYCFTLANPISGNTPNVSTSPELFIRWLQVNVFFPSIEFSRLPWNISKIAEENKNVVRAVQSVLNLREKYAGHIFSAAYQCITDGSPIIRPLFWVDPKDPKTFLIDDEYMMGNNILVAPVIEKDKTMRNIYLPKGQWKLHENNKIYTGPQQLLNFPVPLQSIPIFHKIDEDFNGETVQDQGQSKGQGGGQGQGLVGGQEIHEEIKPENINQLNQDFISEIDYEIERENRDHQRKNNDPENLYQFQQELLINDPEKETISDNVNPFGNYKRDEHFELEHLDELGHIATDDEFDFYSRFRNVNFEENDFNR